MDMNKQEKMTWYDVTLKQFLALQDLFKVTDENERILSIAELLLGEGISDLPLAEFKKKIMDLSFLKEPIPDTIPPKKVKVNNKEYYLDCLLGNITTAQYIDYTNFANTNDIAKMVGVFMIPVGHKYNDGYDMEGVFSDINSLPIPIVNSTAFFFAKQFSAFMRIFQRYSIKRLKKTNLSKKSKAVMIEAVKKSMDLVLSPLSSNFAK